MKRENSAEGESRTPFIGRALPRFEDLRLVVGKGRYTDDFRLEREAAAAFVRSPYAAARIVGIDVGPALDMPGVLAVITGQDYVEAGGQPLRHIADPADNCDHTIRAFAGYARNTSIDIDRLPMPLEAVRYVGEPVAMVVAETANLANDAAEAVLVDYEETGFVITAEEALADGAPQVDPDIPGNRAVEAVFGEPEAAEAAIAAAPCVIEQRFVNQRTANAQMEPRSVIVEYDPETGRYHMIAGSQGAVRQRDTMAEALGIDRDAIDVTCPDTGGAFGARTNVSPEQPILAVAAKRLGRPVRWTSTRSEAFLTDYQGRDIVYRARMGLDADGRILGYACEMFGNVGAYTVSFVPMANSYRVMTNAYAIPAASVHILGAMTNTVPTAPYRGAGRPEATYTIERMLDIAARRLGLDRREIRRRNLVPHDALPFTSPMGLTYDSGDFAGNMQRVLDFADWDGFDKRRKAAEARGKLAGISLANYVESPVGIPHERIDVTVDPAGRIEVVTGTQSSGQGHETSFAQVMADRLGVTPDEVDLVSGDTRRVVSGGGSHSDRSMRLGGALMVEASTKIVASARAALAAHLGIAVDAITYADGLFGSGATNRTFSLYDVAGLMQGDGLPEAHRGSLTATASFRGRIPAFPTGAAVCELEVDPDTGQIAITRYTSIDDVGQPINPLILHGQVHGGIVQGVGQALGEAMTTEASSGQIQTGSFMDYAMVRAGDMPSFDVDLVEDPTQGNLLRVKGGGESGITPALATVMNALLDALAPFGIEHMDMPATPGRVWTAIHEARKDAR
ncbi:xanthine dehydrogenase family protein molybdopterin-binding subunit [Amorphus coralli]|uniref:xanthine dehydrogenase family protein molybdopterin-binding subunit n=1 Tax=Amorphus coralli TaxID=340680 RepID=UPI00035DE2FE|nr:xanthine dehydrogenase family protein molybdopterin-binding subunit [Amorphus coralli]